MEKNDNAMRSSSDAALKVRVVQARHLRHERSLKYPGTTSVSVSFCGESKLTEDCSNLTRPVWNTVICFSLPSQGKDRNSYGSAKEAKANGVSRDSKKWTKSETKSTVTDKSDIGGLSIAGNVGPSARSLEPSTGKALHLSAFSDSLGFSSTLLGEVSIDLEQLWVSGGLELVSDRLSHRYPRKCGGGADGGVTDDESPKYQDEDVVVDTWVKLRRGAGELRIQILMHKPRVVLNWYCQLASVPENNREKLKPTNSFLPFQPTSYPSVMQSPHVLGSDSHIALECKTIYLDGKLTTMAYDVSSAVNSGTGSANASHGEQQSPSSLGSTNKGPMYWPELMQSNQVIVSTPPGQIPLHEIMTSVEERFCYSFSIFYSKMLSSCKSVSPNEEPLCEFSKSRMNNSAFQDIELELDLLYSSISEGIQRDRWRRQLQVSSQLREALECAPPFRAFLESHRGSGGRAGVRVAGKATPPEIPLADLITSGIPSSLNAPDVEKRRESNSIPVEGRMAFDRSTLLGMQLSNVRATVSSVSVTKEMKFRGGLQRDCAVYHISVEFPATRESWVVLRRYRDFRELYASLPSKLHSLMAPLPPKSWRSLSSITMTPDFLEDRRVGLDKVLRRLITVASQAEDASMVPEILSNFLGVGVLGSGNGVSEIFYECDLSLGSEGGPGGNGGGAAQPLALEIHLPCFQTITLSISKHFRLIMWLVLSGAVRRARSWEGLPYSSLAGCVSKEVWITLCGSSEQWDSAASHFDAIEADVTRTYVICDEERETLRRILRSFALHAPSVGYCQAMNFVALFLLRAAGPSTGCIDKDGWQETIAFLLLGSIALDVVPGYWDCINSMTRVQADLKLLRRLANARIPALLSHLDANGLPVEVLACDWLLSLFCRLLPPLTVLRVWSWLLLEGSEVLVFTALAILQLVETSVLESLVPSASANADAINAMASAMHDADELVELAVHEKGLFFSSKHSRFRNQLVKEGVYDQQSGLHQPTTSRSIESIDGC